MRGMDNVLTDIPADKKSDDNTLGAKANNKAAKDEIQLADILKPSTLIIALVTFVLIILFGWYVYVLKPALNENESMIHFMETHRQDSLEKNTKKNINEKSSNTAPAPESPVVTVNANEPTNTVERNKLEQTIEKNKTALPKKHNPLKHQPKKHQHAIKATAISQKPASSVNPSKCSQAEIALHQCP